jgi:uncharacterized membrane protein YgcG
MTRAKKTAATVKMPAMVSSRLLWGVWIVLAGMALLLSFYLPRPAASPPPLKYFEDRAGLVSPEFAAAKAQYLDYLSRTQRLAQIYVVILPELAGSDLEAATIRAATDWRIGANDSDNGLILFVIRGGRKLRLEIGYGMEALITDAVAHRLLEERLVPAFAGGNYESGLEDFLDGLARTLESAQTAGLRATPQYEKLLPFIGNIFRRAWQVFAESETGLRLAFAGLLLALAALFRFHLAIIAWGTVALIRLPWRLYASPTLRGATAMQWRQQLAPAAFLAQPPAILVDLCSETEIFVIGYALYCLAAAFAILMVMFGGSAFFVFGQGHFGGGGATLTWPFG